MFHKERNMKDYNFYFMNKIIAKECGVTEKVAELIGIFSEEYCEKEYFGPLAFTEKKNSAFYLEKAEIAFDLISKSAKVAPTKKFEHISPAIKKKINLALKNPSVSSLKTNTKSKSKVALTGIRQVRPNNANFAQTSKIWKLDTNYITFRDKANTRNYEVDLTDSEAKILYSFIYKYPVANHIKYILNKRNEKKEPNCFKCDKTGPNSYAYSDIGLSVGGTASINGTKNLSKIIKFHNDGYVEDVSLKKNSAKNSYKVEIHASGPKGYRSGSGYTYYTDKTNDTYRLSIYKNKFDSHYVNYSSSNPNIVLITWSNEKIKGYTPLLAWLTQKGWFSGLYKIFGFFRENGIYHASQDAWQQIFGYNNFYDRVFDTFSSMDRAKFDFTVGNKDYAIWAWKGNYYNLGAGAELGIYERVKGMEQYIVNRNLEMPMTLTLYENRLKKTIIDYKPKEKQWWITGFNPLYTCEPPQYLKATYTIDFSSKKDFFDAFKQKINSTKEYKTMGWKFNETTKVATFVFTDGMKI